MKKPEKFDWYIYAMRKEACRFSLVELMGEYDISPEELDECDEYMEKLKKLDSVEV